MSRKACSDCGTRLEKNGVCPNCDEAAFIMDHQSEFVQNPSQQFIDESANGHARAFERTKTWDRCPKCGAFVCGCPV